MRTADTRDALGHARDTSPRRAGAHERKIVTLAPVSQDKSYSGTHPSVTARRVANFVRRPSPRTPSRVSGKFGAALSQFE